LRVRKIAPRSLVTVVDDGPHENSCRPSVDVLFRSLAENYGGEVLYVVLTGMGSDGLHGAEALKTAGAFGIAQDEASSVVWGMPGALARAGLADRILPLDGIPAELIRMAAG
jgi:two-component system chemotaxis response regulator CheB